jgi:hypothetical protein
MQFNSASHYFTTFRSKCSNHFVLKHRQSLLTNETGLSANALSRRPLLSADTRDHHVLAGLQRMVNKGKVMPVRN